MSDPPRLALDDVVDPGDVRLAGIGPDSAMIGSSVAPKASSDSWESQTSNTWI